MDLTPKKLLNSDTNCFICSDAVTSKQRVLYMSLNLVVKEQALLTFTDL